MKAAQTRTLSAQDWTPKGVQIRGQEKLEGAEPWGPRDQARMCSPAGRDKKGDRGHLEERRPSMGMFPGRLWKPSYELPSKSLPL